MTNVPVTRSGRPDIGTPEVPVIKTTAREQELELACIYPGGVLQELALTRWRGLETRGLTKADEQDR